MFDEIIKMIGARAIDLPGVAVAGREAHEAVGEVVVADVGAELAAQEGGLAHGAVPVTDDGLGDQSGEVVIVLPADTLDGESDVGGGDGVIAKTDLGTDELGDALLLGSEGGEGGSRGLAGEATEVLLGEANELLVGDATGTDKDHAVSGVVGLDVFGQVVPGDGLDVLLGAEDGAAKGLGLVSGGVQVVEDDLLKLLVNLLLLAQDHIALTLNGASLELGVLKDISEDIDGLGDIVVEGLGVVDGVLALRVELVFLLVDVDGEFPESYRCVGVKVSAHVLNLEFQLVLGALVGALVIFIR